MSRMVLEYLLFREKYANSSNGEKNEGDIISQFLSKSKIPFPDLSIFNKRKTRFAKAGSFEVYKLEEYSMYSKVIITFMDIFLCMSAMQEFLPFGGRLVIFFGDIWQIPAVNPKGALHYSELAKHPAGYGIAGDMDKLSELAVSSIQYFSCIFNLKSSVRIVDSRLHATVMAFQNDNMVYLIRNASRRANEDKGIKLSDIDKQILMSIKAFKLRSVYLTPSERKN